MDYSHMDDLERTVLHADETALIWNKEKGFFLAFPKFDDDHIVEKEIIVLSVILMRLRDEDFVQEMLDYFENSKN